MNAFVCGFVVLGAIAAASAGYVPLAASYVAAAPVAFLPAAKGLEGEYVPDNTEKLYDDGSYKPEARAIPLAPSPYGLTPAGSGLEGAYVQDLSEKLYDDGSYKPEAPGSGLEGAYVQDLSEKLYDDGSYKPELKH
ncbi:hypothetical protein GWI33_019177 [Rhynchophorus ferrugineus]|uniref:Uncharacterized protein n=1 Tax=Rhynchophorus ferrugineus TaxID=354439 RepID=A0A834M7C5_RHYFE|nr:hypothetical protein GWI33_019177 [Rhynchophorus ferrugineus]